jgi:uncharacterized damage-inducible protein DinB
MIRTKWVERKFEKIADNGLLPGIIERLNGTPVRLEAKVNLMSPDLLSRKSAEHWSVKKEIGHLNDLEPLWLSRVLQIQSGFAVLTAADMSNLKTHQADHDTREIADLISDFRSSRTRLVDRLKSLKDEDLDKSSFHPRLQTPMKIVELAYFVAEHDDHHLAHMSGMMLL